MTRTLGDINTGSREFPPIGGPYKSRCRSAKPWESPAKKTPAVRLLWVTADGVYKYDDVAYVTGKALSRLILIAKRVCNAPPTMELPDNDRQAAEILAEYIIDNAGGKWAMVSIEQQGQYRRVGYRGYETCEQEPRDDGLNDAGKPSDDEDDDLPF